MQAILPHSALDAKREYEFLQEPKFFYDPPIVKDFRGAAIKPPARVVEKSYPCGQFDFWSERIKRRKASLYCKEW